MKLLFDENISPRLVAHLEGTFPGCTHVDSLGLHGQSDAAVWRFARDNGYVIVSRYRSISADPNVHHAWLAFTVTIRTIVLPRVSPTPYMVSTSSFAQRRA